MVVRNATVVNKVPLNMRLFLLFDGTLPDPIQTDDHLHYGRLCQLRGCVRGPLRRLQVAHVVQCVAAPLKAQRS